MNQLLFTVEEENLICAFDTSSRLALMIDINSALPELEDPELREIAEHVLCKLDAMPDAEFSMLILSPAYNDDEPEV